MYYQLYRYDKSSDTYQKLTTVSQTSCSVASLSADSAYQFQVRAVRDIYEGQLIGKPTAACKAQTGPALVTGISQLSTTDTGYRLSWNSVNGAAGYKVFSIDPDTYAYTLIGKTTKPQLKISNLTPGQLVVYVVKAYAKHDGKTYYGANSTEFLASTCPSKVKSVRQLQGTSSSVTIGWKEVGNASGYCVYRYTGSGWKKIASQTALEYTVDSLPAEILVKFRIRAFIRINGKVLWGEWSDTCAASTISQ